MCEIYAALTKNVKQQHNNVPKFLSLHFMVLN
jgi:hypothetical protein